MLSASDIHSIKTGGRLATALSQNRDDLLLKKTLNAIEIEKVQRLREIDIRRKQFLLYHRGAKCNSATEFQRQHYAERQHEKIQAEKNQENRCRTSLDKRKSEFLDTLITRPFTSKTSIRSDIVDEKDAIAVENLGSNVQSSSSREKSPDSEFKLPEYELKSPAMNLYQKSFGIIRRQRQQRVSPFVTSVNTILDKLRGRNDEREKGRDTEEQSNILTRHILGKYVGIDMVSSCKGRAEKEQECATLSDSNKDERNQGSNETTPSALTPELSNTAGQVSEPESKKIKDTNENDKKDMQHITSVDEIDSDSSESSDDLSTIPHSTSNKALNLWASVRKEQKLAKLHTRRRNTLALKRKTNESKADEIVSINVIPPSKTASRYNPSYTAIASPMTPAIEKKANLALDTPGYNSSLSTGSIGKTVVVKGCESPNLLSVGAVKEHDYRCRQQDGKRASPSNRSSSSLVTSSRRRTSSVSSDHSGSKCSTNKKNQYLSPCPPTNYQEIKPKVCQSKTIIIVHPDEEDESEKSKNNDMFLVKDVARSDKTDITNMSEENLASTGNSDGERLPETNSGLNDIANALTVEQTSDNENWKNGEDLYVPGLQLCETPTGTDARSVSTINSLSRVKSGIRKGKSAGNRRLSIQTSGALRMWTAVKREESTHKAQKQDEDIHPDSQAYKNIIDDLAGAVAEAEEQAQRLETVRRASLSRMTPNIKERRVSSSTSRRLSTDTRVSFADNSYEELYDRRQPRGNVNTLSSHRRASADVTDEVYKFLQRKFSSNELRRMSLSTAEQTLLADGPGSDNVGRRNSVSSPHGSSLRSSGINNDTLRRSSLSLDLQQRCQSPKDLVSAVLGTIGAKSRRSSNSGTPRGSLYSHTPTEELSDTESSRLGKKQLRSYSWAPDVSHTRDWHILALEVLARNRTGAAKFRTVSHLLQYLADDYRHQTTAMMYEELRYCTYLRLPKRHMPEDLLDSDVSSVFN